MPAAPAARRDLMAFVRPDQGSAEALPEGLRIYLVPPLLCQVTTAARSPAEIGVPIRSAPRRQRNRQAALAEVTGVDVANRHLLPRGGHVPYDDLIPAAGA